MGWECGQDGWDKECMQNFGGETSWRWENNIKVKLMEVCCEDIKWMDMAQDHV